MAKKVVNPADEVEHDADESSSKLDLSAAFATESQEVHDARMARAEELKKVPLDATGVRLNREEEVHAEVEEEEKKSDEDPDKAPDGGTA